MLLLACNGAGSGVRTGSSGLPRLDPKDPERQEGTRVWAAGQAETQVGKHTVGYLQLDDGSVAFLDGLWPAEVNQKRVVVEATVGILPPSSRGDVAAPYRPVREIELRDWRLLGRE